MKKFYYQNYIATFDEGYIMSHFINDNDLGDAELIQMFKEDRLDYTEGKYTYMMIFKIPCL